MDRIIRGWGAQLPWESFRGPPQPLRLLLRQPPVAIQNHEGRTFWCTAELKRLLTHEIISAWIRTHPLHRHSNSDARDQDLVKPIVDNCRLLFAILVEAELEFLTSTLLDRADSDDSLRKIDWSNLDLNHDQQRSLTERCNEVCPILQKSPHLYLPERTVLPFTKRVPLSHGSFGQIFSVEVAEGHLESYDTVDNLSFAPIDTRITNGTQGNVAEKFQRLGQSGDAGPYLHEVETLRGRIHPNIVPLLASYTMKKTESSNFEVESLHFLFPLAEMDLADWMRKDQPPAWLQNLSPSERRGYLYRFIYGLVSGLSFLHREKDGTITAHHDLKPKNILVFGQELKIADFGRSHLRPLAQGSETQTTHLGTYEYQPPEYMKDDGTPAELNHGRAFDIWSMGCIIVELATLIVHGWESKKLIEFRNQRRDNPQKTRPKLADQHKPDDSFHNNWDVVKNWIHQLESEDGSQKLKWTLNVALQMMNQIRDERLYSWEAELDLYNIQQPDDGRVKRLEIESLCVQSPPPQRKVLNGTQTPLHRAAQKGDLERICQLFEAGWSLYIQDHKGLTAWDVLDRRDDDDFCNTVRERLDPHTPNNTVNEEQGQKLLQAAASGDVERVRNLVAKEVDAMFVDQGNQSALHVAVNHDKIHVAEYLLQAKGKELLRQKDRQWGDTPLHKAVVKGNATMMKKLLAYSPDIEDQQEGGETALFLAVGRGHAEAVDVLLKHGAQVFTRKRDTKETPLHRSAINGSLQILRRLLEAPDANKCLEHKKKSGETPLWVAVFSQHVECAEILLNQGASLHVANNGDDLNVIHAAVEKSMYGFLERNIHRFSRDAFESRNRWNETPLEMARKHGKQNFAKLIKGRLDRDSSAQAS